MTTVITGGATGIGFATARRLGRDGRTVVLASRKRERLEDAQRRLRGEGIACEIAELDVRDADAVDTLFTSLPDVSAVVNNAAGNFVCPTVDLTPNGFRAVVEISLYGCFHCSRALARRLLAEERQGAIVNMVATYAWTGAPAVAHSAAAKAGMIAFTKSVAREWGAHGIRVNAVAPGFVPTDQALESILASGEAQDRMRDLIPLGRFGEPDEVADAVAFLLSDAAAYITGSVVTVDGGRSLGLAMHSVGATRD
ncbi:MAG: SDR family oxidoreductase [Actinomycetota bacterium]|nr:SDR family oxidoreductase [Actinomycetota bacterium]